MSEEFELHFKHFDLEKKNDAWGNPVYLNPHVDSIWYGWKTALEKAIPAGYALVPVEPTEKMINEGGCAQSVNGGHRYIGNSAAATAYKHMLAAATAPSQQKHEPIAWHTDAGNGLIQYVSDARYKKFAPSIQKFYRPYEVEKREPLSDVADWVADTWPMDKRYTLEEIVERIRTHGIGQDKKGGE